MPYEEPQLNGRLAHHIRGLTSELGWHIQEEYRGAFEDEGGKKPDIVIRRDGASPIVIENEYAPGSTLEADCIGRLGSTVVSSGARRGGRVAVVFAVRSPRELRQCDHSDQADAMLRDGIELEYAVYSPKNSAFARFPKSGFISGDVGSFVEFMKPASIPQDEVDRAADALARGATEAASVLVDCGRSRGLRFGTRIGEKLRQPWPEFTEMPNTRRGITQYRADEEARLQTATMCAVILINALAYQQKLANYHEDIHPMSEVPGLRGSGQLSKLVVCQEWTRVLAINYWPVFHIAQRLLVEIPDDAVRAMIGPMVATADEMQSAMRQHDVAGIVFQRLIADRKTLKTYYTLPASTVLVANLGVHDDRDWSNPEVMKSYRVADYASGTGGLVMAAYQRMRNLHRGQGGSPDGLHRHMMEHSLTACDIMPAAVHLSSSLLSAVVPNQIFDGTRNILYPFGGRKQRDDRGNTLTDADGNPVLERDEDGKPVVDIGSLELLDINATKMQVVLPTSEQMAMGANGKRRPIEVAMSPANDDLVIMNPPFTRPTKHAPFSASDHVEPANPAFAAFGTSEEEQNAMKAKERRLGEGTISDGNAGLGTTFTAIAHNMVRDGGRIALILPTAAMMGGSFDPSRSQAYSWQRLRNLLNDCYDQVVVVSVAQPAQRDSAFSADSDYADCIVIARRTDTPPEPNLAHFVNLKSRPFSMLEAQETANAIRAAIGATVKIGSHKGIRIGDDAIGFVALESIRRNTKWGAVRIADASLYERARLLCSGELALPQSFQQVELPVVPMRQVAVVGPIDRDIVATSKRGAFDVEGGSGPTSEFPVLWNHPRRGKENGDYRQDRMLTRPDTHGRVRDGRVDVARKLWTGNAANLHINRIFRFNANPTAAAWTDAKSLGGSVWPTLKIDGADLEKAMCVWLNSTLGMVVFWIESNRTQDGRGITTVTAIRNLPVLDVRALPPDRLSAAAAIFDDLRESAMLPANEAYRDPVRQELDRRLVTEALGLDEAAADQVGILRNQWCAEPTVNGTKRTGIAYR